MSWKAHKIRQPRKSRKRTEENVQAKITSWFKTNYVILSQQEIEFEKEIVAGFILPDGKIAQLRHTAEHAIAAEKALGSAGIKSDHVFVTLAQHGFFRVLGDKYQMNIDVGTRINEDQIQTIKELVQGREFYWSILSSSSIKQGSTWPDFVAGLREAK